MTIHDIENCNELINNIIEDISEIPEDTVISYDVWAIGYVGDDNITDSELLLDTFENPDSAVNYAKSLVLADILDLAKEDNYTGPEPNIDYISIEVETVVPDEDGGTMNIGTIYKKVLWTDSAHDNTDAFGGLL